MTVAVYFFLAAAFFGVLGFFTAAFFGFGDLGFLVGGLETFFALLGDFGLATFLAAVFFAAVFFAALGFFSPFGLVGVLAFLTLTTPEAALPSPLTDSLNEPDAPLPLGWVSLPDATAAFRYFLMNGASFSASTL